MSCCARMFNKTTYQSFIRNKLLDNEDVYYMKQTYYNMKGSIYYTEVHKITIVDNYILGCYILSRKSNKYYAIYTGNTWHGDITTYRNVFYHMALKSFYRVCKNNIKLEIVPFREVEDLVFLNNI